MVFIHIDINNILILVIPAIPSRTLSGVGNPSGKIPAKPE